MRVNVCSAVLVPCVFSLAQLILRVEVSQGLSLVVTRKMDGRGGRGGSCWYEGTSENSLPDLGEKIRLFPSTGKKYSKLLPAEND